MRPYSVPPVGLIRVEAKVCALSGVWGKGIQDYWGHADKVEYHTQSHSRPALVDYKIALNSHTTENAFGIYEIFPDVVIWMHNIRLDLR